jgi:phospholipase C
MCGHISEPRKYFESFVCNYLTVWNIFNETESQTMNRIFISPSYILLSALLSFILILSGSLSNISIYAMEFTTTTTPIKHLVVLFQENSSFDHYFATYPIAENPTGEPQFLADSSTPEVNNLRTAGLLDQNPNSALPFRLDRSQALMCDNDHSYTAEQKAYNGGKVNKFVQSTASVKPGFLFPYREKCLFPPNTGKAIGMMGYYDGNTVTGLWNYAQKFAMSDNFFGSTFGPSTPGHINLISGQTHGATCVKVDSLGILKNYYYTRCLKGAVSQGTMIYDPDPAYDDCSASLEDSAITHFVVPVNDAVPTFSVVSMVGKNVGDLLNNKSVTWGWFSAGFKPTSTSQTKNCGHSYHTPDPKSGVFVNDYYANVEPFQYYASTSNPHHMPPTTIAMIGHPDQANHQYDLSDFWNATLSGNMPSVSFIKAPSYQQEHPGISTPLLGQQFVVSIMNRLQQLPQWEDMAVIITYDDSDGWYDHVMPPIVNPSSDRKTDRLFGSGLCGNTTEGAYQDRCGYGPRLPMLVISPYANVNYIDHTITDHTSILRFIEDNWGLGRIGDQSFDTKAGSILSMFNFTAGHKANKLFLDPDTGTIISGAVGSQVFTLPF